MSRFPLNDSPSNLFNPLTFHVLSWTYGVEANATQHLFLIILFDQFASLVLLISEYVLMGRDRRSIWQYDRLQNMRLHIWFKLFICRCPLLLQKVWARTRFRSLWFIFKALLLRRELRRWFYNLYNTSVKSIFIKLFCAWDLFLDTIKPTPMRRLIFARP